MSSYAVGDAVYYLLPDPVAVPSIADVFYLAMYPLVACGLMIIVRRRAPQGDRTGLLDALIISLGGGLLSWVFLIAPELGQTTVALGTRLTSIAYPLCDAVLLAVVARLWSDRGSRGASFVFFGGGLLPLLAADSLYAWQQLHDDYQVGAVLDVAWLACFLCIGAAAVHPSMRELDAPAATAPRISRVRFAILLAVASLLVPLLVSIRAAGREAADLPVFTAVSAALFALVLVRMAGLVKALRQMQFQRSEERFHRLTAHVTDVISACDRTGVVQYQTPSIGGLLGFPPDAFVGRSILDLVHPADIERVAALLEGDGSGTDGDGNIGPVECRLRRADGGYVDTETLGRVVDDEDLSGFLLTTRDVTERKAFEEQLTEKAFHDELTGLANRALLVDRAQHALDRRGSPYRQLAVVVVDIDDFKTVNDSLGRAVGDELLRAVADRLRSCLRSADTAARLSGDEFAMLLDDLDSAAEAARIAERVLAALRQPITLHGREIVPRASVGIALADPDRVPDADDLLRNADVAMHMAKREGRNRYAYFAPSMHSGLMQKLDLTADLRGALERHELTVHYQPIVDLEDGRILGAEALVRWPHAEHGMVSPEQFIPIAEETGLVLALGYEVLNTACREAARWPGLTVGVNLSPKQVQDPALVLYVQQALHHSGLSPDALTLEITESLLSEDGDVAAHRLADLKALGVRLAVDDFGTGYSSLSRLHDFPIDMLKIPKPFVDGVALGEERSALARAIVELSAALGLRVVAEGIEQAEQAAALRALGCRTGQGFYYARPMPAGDFLALMQPSRTGS
jgi:diguanylate cyclase (GGDEF)-like protein/PAS domain S-box-containing protein